MVTAVSSTKVRDGQDWFPLSVEYKEKAAAAGRFPGGYFKREGRPTEKEILTCRMTDRPLRPLFPKGYFYDTQIVSLLLSADGVHDADILSINGASAAISISDIPFAAPIAAVRVGRVNGEFVANPTFEAREESDLDLVYVGLRDKVIMIEGAGDEVPDEEFKKALLFGQEAIQPILDAIEALKAKVGKATRDYSVLTAQDELLELGYATIGDRIEDAIYAPTKHERGAKVKVLREEMENAIKEKFPDEADFPYAIRVVSEVMESNGSTSMASVCSGTMSLLDAGVPLKRPVAGISSGLVTEFSDAGDLERYVTIVDIIGSEDFFGDMDFKLCGTTEGVTGYQLDLKLPGVDMKIFLEGVDKATAARLKVLEFMDSVINAPATLSEHAPRIESIKIDPQKIGELIGPGGKNIKGIQAETGADINISDDGTVQIYAAHGEALNRAIDLVKRQTAEIEVGALYEGKIVSTTNFGAFMEVLPGKDGMIHISELADFRVEKVEDVVKVGDVIWAKCIGVDERGRVKMSRQAAMAERAVEAEAELNKGGDDSEGENA
ncbi:UNVERIFIED_CONTAM: hypothetical protein GTU68_056217 [Idotea baltica]|nr:hypothetical protein [Idotea baltica]